MAIGTILKTMVKWGLIFGSCLAIVLLSAYAVIQVMLRGGDVVEVPNVVGDSFVTAWRKLDEVGLQMRSEAREYNPIVPKDHIISQSPVPGSKVKADRAVRVTVSMGSEMLAVPDVTLEELQDAKIKLADSRLGVGHVSHVHFGAKSGIILAQNPPPKAPIEVEGKVDLLVSAGPRRPKYLVPTVVGMKQDEALTLLSALRFQVRYQQEVRSGVKHGIVLAQEPAPNEVLEESGSVLLTVSARSKEKRWKNLRYMVLRFQVPFGFSQKLVRVEIADSLGKETVLEDPFAPGEVITLPLSYKLYSAGERAAVRVFVDGVLRQETYADASEERTLMFTQP